MQIEFYDTIYGMIRTLIKLTSNQLCISNETKLKKKKTENDEIPAKHTINVLAFRHSACCDAKRPFHLEFQRNRVIFHLRMHFNHWSQLLIPSCFGIYIFLSWRRRFRIWFHTQHDERLRQYLVNFCGVTGGSNFRSSVRLRQRLASAAGRWRSVHCSCGGSCPLAACSPPQFPGRTCVRVVWSWL